MKLWGFSAGLAGVRSRGVPFWPGDVFPLGVFPLDSAALDEVEVPAFGRLSASIGAGFLSEAADRASTGSNR